MDPTPESIEMLPEEEERRRTRVGFIVTVLILAGLVAGEIYYRGIRMHRVLPPYDIHLHTMDGYPIGRPKGNLKLRLDPFTVYTNLPEQETEKFTIGPEGFRGPRVDLSVRKEKRIAILGGSAAFGLLAGSDDQTFAGLLARAHPDWQVINAGVTGFLSGQELAHLVHHVVDTEPDLVVVFDGWNDLFVPWFGPARTREQMGFNSNFHGIETQLRLNLLTQEKVIPSLIRFLTALAGKSALVEGLGTALAGQPDPEKAIRQPEEDGTPRDEAYFATIHDSYLTNLEKMKDFCLAREIQILIAIQPEIGHRQNRGREEKKILRRLAYYRDHFPARYHRFAHQTVTSPRLEGARVVDLNTDSRIRLSPGDLFADYVHYTPAGNRVVAEALNEKILSVLSE
jgi:lysophospholipase L1-like esterase